MVQKYSTAPRKDKIIMNSLWRPCPSDKPSRNSPRPHTSQNRKSVTAVTVFDRALLLTTRKISYKKPAAAPSTREEAA
jgi:hypothetical protein